MGQSSLHFLKLSATGRYSAHLRQPAGHYRSRWTSAHHDKVELSPPGRLVPRLPAHVVQALVDHVQCALEERRVIGCHVLRAGLGRRQQQRYNASEFPHLVTTDQTKTVTIIRRLRWRFIIVQKVFMTAKTLQNTKRYWENAKTNQTNTLCINKNSYTFS